MQNIVEIALNYCPYTPILRPDGIYMTLGTPLPGQPGVLLVRWLWLSENSDKILYVWEICLKCVHLSMMEIDGKDLQLGYKEGNTGWTRSLSFVVYIRWYGSTWLKDWQYLQRLSAIVFWQIHTACSHYTKNSANILLDETHQSTNIYCEKSNRHTENKW